MTMERSDEYGLMVCSRCRMPVEDHTDIYDCIRALGAEVSRLHGRCQNCQKIYLPRHLAKEVLKTIEDAASEGQGGDTDELLIWIRKEYPDLAKDSWVYLHLAE